MKEMVNNVPEYAKDYPVWIVTDCEEDGLWFYGAYSMAEKNKANEIAMELDKMVITE